MAPSVTLSPKTPDSGRGVSPDSSQVPVKSPSSVPVSWQWRDPVTRLDYEGRHHVLMPDSVDETRKTLPIYVMKQEIVKAVERNQVHRPR